MTATIHRALACLRHHALPQTDLGDAELLQAFVASRDQTAFSALLRRHGPMVFAVCLRVAGHPHDAEDAFQATFLVLLRKAATLQHPNLLGNWLHGVAYRTARKARSVTVRSTGTPLSDMPANPEPEPNSELFALLDQELRSLPDKYRVLIVMCDLEGRPRKQVARQLGLNEGTLSSRLATARGLLAGRLSGYGLGLSAVALTAALTKAFAEQPRPSPGIASSPTPRVEALATAVTHALNGSRLKQVALLVFGVVLLAGGFALAPRQERNGPAPAKPADVKPPPAKAGGRILFWLDEQLAVVGPDGKNLTRLPEFARHLDLPCLAPDGKQVAYAPWNPHEDNPEHKPLPIYLTPLDGKPSPLAKLARKAGLDLPVGESLGVKGRPISWSADGTRLLCVEPPRTWWVVDVKTKEKKELSIPEGHWFADWSPDESRILTERRAKKDDLTSELQLFLLKKDGTELRRLTPGGHSGWGARFSPDGKRVLFCGRETPTDGKEVFARPSRVYVIDLPDGVAKPTSPELNALVETACWSPDGKRIAYPWRRLEERDDPLDSRYETDHFLQIIDADGRNPVVLHAEKGPAARVFIARPQWR